MPLLAAGRMPRRTYRVVIKSSDVQIGTALDGTFAVNVTLDQLDLPSFYQCAVEDFVLVRGTSPSTSEATESVFVTCAGDLPQTYSVSGDTVLCTVNHLTNRRFVQTIDKNTTIGFGISDSRLLLGGSLRIRLADLTGAVHSGLGSGVAWVLTLVIY